MDAVKLNQDEHEHISSALEVERVEDNLFRSRSLWLPKHSRGVFGGQVISQALVSATNCVDAIFALHSLHCYFLDSASPSTPIVYFVERLRKGRSYVTCSVKAVQKGTIIFVLLCSFQKPEPWQPSHEWSMPVVPAPEDCELEEDRFLRASKSEKTVPELRQYFIEFAQERARSPISVKFAKETTSNDHTEKFMYWMQAKNISKPEAPFQKCILAYLSDLYFIGTASRVLKLKRHGTGKDSRGMTSSLDHSVYYYDNDFDCGDWLLVVMVSPRTGSGRGVVHGQVFSRTGKLVAITSQEGVVRANIRGPKPEAGAKL